MTTRKQLKGAEYERLSPESGRNREGQEEAGCNMWLFGKYKLTVTKDGDVPNPTATIDGCLLEPHPFYDCFREFVQEKVHRIKEGFTWRPIRNWMRLNEDLFDSNHLHLVVLSISSLLLLVMPLLVHRNKQAISNYSLRIWIICIDVALMLAAPLSLLVLQIHPSYPKSARFCRLVSLLSLLFALALLVFFSLFSLMLSLTI